jgi:hypothetical protein
MAGFLIGNEDRGTATGAPVELRDIRAGTHILGLPDQGKSALMASIAEQAISAGEAAIVIDVKDGALARELAARTKFPDRVEYFAPGLAPPGKTVGLNLLADGTGDAITNALSIFEAQGDVNDSTRLVNLYLPESLKLALAAKEPTLKTALDLLQDPRVRLDLIESARSMLQRDAIPPGFHRYEWAELVSFWDDFVRTSSSSSRISNPLALSATQHGRILSTIGRLQVYLRGNRYLSAALRLPENTFHLEEWADAGKLIICDFGSGIRNVKVSELFANIVMTMIVNLGDARDNSKPFVPLRVVCDEFDQLNARAFSRQIDKLRSVGIRPVLANQMMSQITDKELLASLSGLRNKVFFAIAGQDRQTLRYHLNSDAEASELLQLKRYHARVYQQSPPKAVELPPWLIAMGVKVPSHSSTTGVPTRVKLLLPKDIPGQYDEILERFHANTRPHHGSIEGDEIAHDYDTKRHTANEPEPDDVREEGLAAQGAAEVGAHEPEQGTHEAPDQEWSGASAEGDSAGRGDPPGPEPAPDADRGPDREAALGGADELGASVSTLHEAGSEGQGGRLDPGPVAPGADPEDVSAGSQLGDLQEPAHGRDQPQRRGKQTGAGNLAAERRLRRERNPLDSH